MKEVIHKTIGGDLAVIETERDEQGFLKKMTITSNNRALEVFSRNNGA